jgi:beta-carotene hydroxylase
MNDSDLRDQEALHTAKHYMGKVAWPTIALGVVIWGSYVAIPLLVATGVTSLALALPIMAFLTYAAYTVLHDAVHGSITGSRKSLRWINETLGYAMAWIMMIPLTAHRHEHLAHHRNTNQPDGDPDFVVANMGKSPLHAAWAAIRIVAGQFGYYRRNRWGQGPRKQDVYLCIEVCAALIPRLAFIAAGFWWEGIVLFVFAPIIGVAILMFLFAYIVHTPHESVGRYVDTSTFVAEGVWGNVVTALWGFQNYHSIHHLFPRVPFYTYRSLFRKIEHIMVAESAPIYQLTGPKSLRGSADQQITAG